MKCSKPLQRFISLKFPSPDTGGYKNHTDSTSYFSSFLVSETRTQCFTARSMSLKNYLDYSKVPKVNEADIEVQLTRGSGPGGQATNKTNNAVLIKHKPTGIVVKCHQTRSMWDNKKKAMENLVTKLDNLVNGEESIEAQTKSYMAKKSAGNSRKKRKLNELKAAFKEREGLE